MKTGVIQARVERHHMTRLVELQRLTGLSQSEVLRKLLETADIAPAPMPISKIKQNGTGQVRQDKVASAVL